MRGWCKVRLVSRFTGLYEVCQQLGCLALPLLDCDQFTENPAASSVVGETVLLQLASEPRPKK